MSKAFLVLFCLGLSACGAGSISDAGGSIADAGGSIVDTKADTKADRACPPGLTRDEPSNTCRKEAVQYVPMTDGVRLWTKVFLPEENLPSYPALLTRDPYRFPMAREAYDHEGRFHAARGYAFVRQDVRGAYDSEGAFLPFEQEFSDGRASAEWIAAQSWCNGDVGLIGTSYPGFTALAGAVDSSHVRMVISDDSIESPREYFTGGIPSLAYIGWHRVLATEGAAFSEASGIHLLPQALADKATNTIDVLNADQEVLGNKIPLWNEMVDGATPEAAFWSRMSMRGRFDKTCVPLLAIKAQANLAGPVTYYRGFVEQGCSQFRDAHRLIISPDGHGDDYTLLLNGTTTPVGQAILDFVDQWLGKRGDRATAMPPVRYREPAGTAWRTSDTWPPPTTSMEFYLGTGVIGDPTLSVLGDAPISGAAQLVVDPKTANPCAAGYPYAAFASAPLGSPLRMVGEASLTLFVEADARDGDVFADIYEYVPSTGESIYTWARAFLRLRYRGGFSVAKEMPAGVAQEIKLTFNPLAYTFKAGNHIVLVLAPGQCGFSENPQTGDRLGDQKAQRSGTFLYRHAPAFPSKLTLQIGP